MERMYFMTDTFNNRVKCPMMTCPMMQTQQMNMNSPCMNYKYYNTFIESGTLYRSNPCEKMRSEMATQKVNNKNIFQIEMRSVPLSEIED